MTKKISAILILAAGPFIWGCSSTPSCLNVVPPKVNLTGEKTVIERQIIGDYEEIEKDAWAVSSVKRPSTGTEPEVKKTADSEMLKAMNIREKNLPIIRDHKNSGALGESNKGYLSYIKNEKYESNRLLKNQLLDLIKSENSARKTIFTRATLTGGKPDEAKASAFGAEFSRELQALAQKNDWIQNNEGNWVRK